MFSISLVVQISVWPGDILDILVLLDMLAERTSSLLHLCDLVYILKEELAAFVAVVDCHVGDNILVDLAGPLRAQLRIVDDKYLFEAYALEYAFIDLNQAVLVRVYQVFDPFEHAVVD